MSLGESLKKSIVGSEKNEIIASRTLVVNRGFGISVGLIGLFLLLDLLGDVGPWKTMDAWQQALVLVASLVWAIVAAADAMARGRATATAQSVAVLPIPLAATLNEGKPDSGWSGVGLRLPTAGNAGEPDRDQPSGGHVPRVPTTRGRIRSWAL